MVNELLFHHGRAEQQAATCGYLEQLSVGATVEAPNLDGLRGVREYGARPEAWSYPFPVVFAPLIPASSALAESFSISSRTAW
jgi:hypothetical protein